MRPGPGWWPGTWCCGRTTMTASPRRRSAGWCCRSSRGVAWPSWLSGRCSAWPATTAGGDSYTPSRPRRTGRRTGSAARPASGSPVSGAGPSPVLSCAATTGSSTPPSPVLRADDDTEFVGLGVGQDGGPVAFVVDGAPEDGGAQGDQAGHLGLAVLHPQVQVRAVLALLGLGHALQQHVRLPGHAAVQRHVRGRRPEFSPLITQGRGPEISQGVRVSAVEYVVDTHVRVPIRTGSRFSAEGWWARLATNLQLNKNGLRSGRRPRCG